MRACTRIPSIRYPSQPLWTVLKNHSASFIISEKKPSVNRFF
ncbi:hypothetical protein B4072_1718 [Bacillus subtilis]|nr:hypothetical protein B4069_1607 [Bacillus subtilis]KIN48834.1 hypothetical protein B4072_1718 [Bacillus subtilis]